VFLNKRGGVLSIENPIPMLGFNLKESPDQVNRLQKLFPCSHYNTQAQNRVSFRWQTYT